MKNRNVKLIIFSFVLAAILVVGGVVYVSLTAVDAARYQSVMATVVQVKTEKKDENSVVVKSVTVQYETPQGTVRDDLSGQLPDKLQEGGTLSVRYKKSDTSFVTAERIDWGTPIFLLVIGVLYAVGSIVFVHLRKKAGDYALYDGSVEGDGVFEDEPETETEQKDVGTEQSEQTRENNDN